MAKKFFSLPRIVQILLLLIPVVGGIIELIIRWSAVAEKFSALNLVAAILFTVVGWGWVLNVIDIIWILAFKHLFLTKV